MRGCRIGQESIGFLKSLLRNLLFGYRNGRELRLCLCNKEGESDNPIPSKLTIHMVLMMTQIESGQEHELKLTRSYCSPLSFILNFLYFIIQKIFYKIKRARITPRPFDY